MIKRIVQLTIFIILIGCKYGFAQWPALYNGYLLNPSNPTKAYNHLAFSGELFNMDKGNIWEWNFKAGFAFSNNRQLISIDVPFVRTVYSGVENLYGIGDLTLRYHWVMSDKELQTQSMSSSAFMIDISLPTGNEYDGHGSGVPVVSPALVFAFKPVEEIGIYPKIRYVHSIGNTTGDWSGGYPGVGAGTSSMVRVMLLEALFNVEFNQAWLGVAPLFSYEFQGNEGTLSIRPEIGKLFGNTLSIKLTGAIFIAGRQRFNSWTMFELRYFF